MINSASWTRFAILFVLLAGFSYWAFNMDGPWSRALDAAGGLLPETQTGFPPIEPGRSLEALGDATSDYALWQIVDLVYIALNVLIIGVAIGLGLKKAGLANSFMRFFLALPLIYGVAELIENSFFLGYVAGVIPSAGAAALVQQLFTTIKMAAGFGGMAIALISLILAAVSSVFRRQSQQ